MIMKFILAFSIFISLLLTLFVGCSKEKECFQCNNAKGFTLYCKEDDNNLKVMSNGFPATLVNAKEFKANNADEALSLLKKDSACN